MPSNKVKETVLWLWLSSARRHFKLALHMTRVENSVALGVPDVEGCLEGDQFWIELKTIARPVRPTTKLKIRFEDRQIPWMKRRINAGGRAFVLLQVGAGHDARRYLVDGMKAHRLEEGMTEKGINGLSYIAYDNSPEDIISTAAL